MASADGQSEQQVQRLYEISSILDAAPLSTSTATAEHEKLYDEILQASKGGRNAKMLSAQLIPKYLKHFQKATDKAINTLMDLCEEDDVSTRVHAIRALPIIAKDTPENVPKLADILGQLLQAEELELDNVKHALMSLLRLDTKGTLDALFNQVITSEDEVLREKAILFIREKVIPMRAELIHPREDVQRAVADHIKKMLQDVSAGEFHVFMDLLHGLPIYKGQAAHELLDLLAQQSDPTGDFQVGDAENVSRLTTCLRLSLPVYQRGATSTRLMQLLATKVLPSFSQIAEPQQLQLVKHIADISSFLTSDDAKILLPSLYNLMVENIPVGAKGTEPKINFTLVENLLYTFHQLAQKAPGLLRGLCGISVMTGQPSDMSGEIATDRRKDLDARLKYLDDRVKSYITQVKQALQSLATSKEVTDKVAKQAKTNNLSIALKTQQNIQLLAESLLKPSPHFINKNQLTLSWKTATPKTETKSQAAQGKPAATTTATTATNKTQPNANTNTSNNNLSNSDGAANKDKGARPVGEVYVPPARRLGSQKKRPAEDTPAPTGSSAGKKFRGRGNRTF